MTIWLAALAGATLPADAWAQGPMGVEFLVNEYTTGLQSDIAVGSDGNGDFLAVWFDERNEGDVVGRWFDTGGAPLGPEFAVAEVTSSQQFSPALSAAANGNFVVVWTTFTPDGFRTQDVVGRRFGPGGALGGEFPVNTTTGSGQNAPDVATAADGSFVVVWDSDFQDGSNEGIFARRFDAAGVPLGGEFQVNTTTALNQFDAAVAARPDGGFVVVWTGVDSQYWGIFGRIFDSTGTPQGPEFPINTYMTGRQFFPEISADAGGNFVVVWYNQWNASNAEVSARRFDAMGSPLGSDFQVNTLTTNFQAFPDVAMDRDGHFLVTWFGDLQGVPGETIVGQRFDNLGNRVDAEFAVNTHTTGRHTFPAVATVARGDFVVVWQSDGQDGDGEGLFGQRYGDLIFRDGAETGDLSRWSSASTDGGDLSVQPGAALADTALGLHALVDDPVPLFVRDDRPNAEDHYRARFYFDTNGFDPGETTGHRRVRLFIAFNAANQRLATIVLRRLGGAYALMGRVRRDDATRADTGFHTIGDGAHMVELRWQRAGSGPDGLFTLRIDDVEVSALTGLDNGGSAIEYARLGVMSIKSAAASGTMYFDQFEVAPLSAQIGPE